MSIRSSGLTWVATCLFLAAPRPGLAGPDADFGRQLQRLRDPGRRSVSFEEVLRCFRDRPCSVAERALPVTTSSGSGDARFPRVIRCRTPVATVEFHLPPELASRIREADFARGGGANLVRAVAVKIDRSHRFYKRLLQAAGRDAGRLDHAVPRQVLFYVDDLTAAEIVARAGRQGTFLGHRTLLQRFGQIAHHELFHAVAREVLRADEPRFYSATALNEGLADYFTAVATNQPRLLHPPLRLVKNRLREAVDGRALAGSHHRYSQLLSGLLWDLRRAVNRREGRAFAEISTVDRLALAAFVEARERPRQTTDLRAWIDLLLRADQRLDGGRHADLIARLGARRLGEPAQRGP